ncbi:MAG TPA: hypothetical protein P5120_10040 [Spirochaetota bacterium]|nr:hypothetical protein [Spirochaetota bacterium]HPF06239.1 hypothetical protein [Spirochaetota bacterium]HPJ41422.1 hypothetical protein [Spirochaetota bacterium]HPR36477.1 hypothetical protein [Spirochaetota bacterium]HRX47848.1 hypothetical protein [Spirochaetota bacterium]
MSSQFNGEDFFEYWDSLGLFDNIQVILPPQFLVLFEIARNLFTDRTSADALNAIEEISKEEAVYIPEREQSISVNRIERQVPLSDKMEIETYKNIIDLKRALPRELAMDDDIFSAKLFTRTLMVQKHYESESDHFKPVTTIINESGRDANRFEQIFYILLDTSRSMDMHMRSFYSKCIVAEFLRRKLTTNARLFFRTFDTQTGDLYKIEKKEDYPFLIEKVLFATTGGVSTNLQKAVYQAVDDINYTKDMANAEILVVTDGVSRIDPDDMIARLGNTKLHVLKIGEDMPEPDFYEIKSAFAGEGVDFDPTSIKLKDVKNIINNPEASEKPLTAYEKRAYRLILDYSNRMFKDLKRVAKHYIEVGDLKTEGLYDVSYENLENLFHWIKKLESTDPRFLNGDEKERLYKQVFFLGQYLKMLIEYGKTNQVELKAFYSRIEKLKSELMKDTELFLLIVRAGKYHEDKKKLKLDRKEARKLMKNMSMKKQKITTEDMKRAQLTFSFQPGEGSVGMLFKLLFIKLMQFLKALFTNPKSLFKKEEGEKFAGIEYFDGKDKKNLH